MEIAFDIRGNLVPHDSVEMSFTDFEELFVSSFDETSSRHEIFREYTRYLTDLQKVLNVPFKQWINGSFVTNRRNPADIDFVTFIDYLTYEEKEESIDNQFSKWTVGNFYQNLDAYTVWEYPENHPYFATFQSDLLYWQDWFSRTQFNRAKKRFPKGFIQLKFD